MKYINYNIIFFYKIQLKYNIFHENVKDWKHKKKSRNEQTPV